MSAILNRIVQRDLHTMNQKEMFKYVNLSIINNNDVNSQPIPLIFSESRNYAIIENAQQYYAYVQRFHIPTLGVPVFIPDIQATSDPNLTIYSFTLKYKNYVYQQYYSFSPQNTGEPTPNNPLTSGQDLTSQYYFVNSYSFLYNALNDVLKACFNGLKSTVQAGGDTLPTNNAPFIIFDPTSNELYFNFDQAGFDNSLTDPIYLYVNYGMYNLMSSFEYIYENNPTSGMTYRFNVYGNEINLLNLSTYQAIQLFEQYPSINVFNPVQSIVMTSNLPVVDTVVSKTYPFNSTINLQNNSNVNVSLPILVDFQIQQGDYQAYVDFVADFPKLLDMTTHNDISEIKIECFWKDIYNNLHRLYLTNGQNCNILLCFRRKAYSENF